MVVIHMHGDLVAAINNLSEAFFEKSNRFSGIAKMGRTQLRDVAPLTLGQEMHAYGTTIGYGVQSVQSATSKFRVTHLVGEREVPLDAYHGMQTVRGIENYNITGILARTFPGFVIATAQVKKDLAQTEAICHACDELIDPEADMAGEHNEAKFRANLLVEMVQGGARTSTAMTACKVITNRALQIVGQQSWQC